MSKPQKLHPISYFNGLINAIKQNIVVFIIFIFFQLKDFDFSNPASYTWSGIVLVFFLLSYIPQIIRIMNTRYWIENNTFILTTGLFNKKRKELNIKRIQSIDMSQGVVNQIIGGVDLQIKTPSDGIVLSVISKKQGEYLENYIDQLQSELKQEELQIQNEEKTTNNSVIDQRVEKNETEIAVSDLDGASYSSSTIIDKTKRIPVYQMRFKELLFMAMTSGAIGVTLAALVPVYGAVRELIPWSKLSYQISQLVQFISITILIIILLVLLVAYIIGTIITMIRFYGFTVMLENEQLKIEYGFINKKRMTVPTKRLQAVVERQSHIRKLFGYTAIHFIITSDFENKKLDDDENDAGSVTILPFIKRDKAYQIIQNLIPNLSYQQVNEGMPLSGFHRHILIPSTIVISMAAIGWYFWNQLLWLFMIVSILIIGLLVLKGYLYVKHAGFKMTEDQMTIQNFELFKRNIYYFKENHILGFDTWQHPLLKSNSLSNFNFIIAKGMSNESINLKYARSEDVQMLKLWYLRGEKNGAL
ncbi:PH domain-containing protein [Staphylococcus schweitzeri]|uniref:Membrane spanning protein n=1 Tax=Staphylococcus schweitzeri TaxID=1654388 RepID=A0A077UK94_9STAP|nr:PH domain-containing protein [Staphylococcus schweitzeri]CDR28814.1 membrane spanning protein [Staphylococcus schweitzeri]